MIDDSNLHQERRRSTGALMFGNPVSYRWTARGNRELDGNGG
jgi:hypothetical protein